MKAYQLSDFTRLRSLNGAGPSVRRSKKQARSLFRGGLRIVLISALYFLVGCATTSTSLSTLAEQQLRDDMVRDLVSAVPQILEPLSTTIQFSDEESGDVGFAVLQIVDLGFGLQRVDADQGRYFLRLENVTKAADAANQETRLRLSLGSIELTRSYRVLNKNNKIAEDADVTWRGRFAAIPSSQLLVAGTQTRLSLAGVELAAGDANDSTLIKAGVQYTDLAPIEGGIPSISLITRDLVNEVVQRTGPGLSLLYADTFKLENMTHVADAAFASISDNYNRIGRETVIFPNDSQNLGRPGKLLVQKLFNRFSENTDLVGIIGCSNGATALSIGNEGLALGRAKRIAEEFYTAGVTRDKVFNEGCWSTETNAPGFPNRGVVVDLWRRKG